MMIPINLKSKFQEFNAQWHPHQIAQIEDMQVLLAKVQGDFVWHKHDEEDELFFVVKGTLLMQFRDRTEVVKEGELIIVPKGVEHKPYAEQECKVMLIEPSGVVNTGEAGGELTAENDVWV